MGGAKWGALASVLALIALTGALLDVQNRLVGGTPPGSGFAFAGTGGYSLRRFLWSQNNPAFQYPPPSSSSWDPPAPPMPKITPPTFTPPTQETSDCFPADATVTLLDGSTKTMGDLTVGDMVATVDASGAVVFEPVYFFGHRVASDVARYVRIHVSSSHGSATLELSPGHFVHSNAPGAPQGFASRIATRATAVTPGATMWLTSSHSSVEAGNVTSVEVVHKRGLFNPYTMGGDIIVNGVLASSHSDWILDPLMPVKMHHIMPAVYQHLFSPLRFIYRLVGPAAVEAVHQQAAIAKKGSLAYALCELVSWPIIQKSEL